MAFLVKAIGRGGGGEAPRPSVNQNISDTLSRDCCIYPISY